MNSILFVEWQLPIVAFQVSIRQIHWKSEVSGEILSYQLFPSCSFDFPVFRDGLWPFSFNIFAIFILIQENRSTS